MRYPYLKNINDPSDLRELPVGELSKVALELRNYILDVVAEKPGHLGASLGVIELTLALHYVFNTPEDKLVWDVGHQAYPHKILTGRREAFETNRQKDGISGFPNMAESPYDAFGTGHSSTSISAALGMAIAAQLQGDYKRQHLAVIGDASIVSGMAFEGLNHSGVTDANLLIVLNDNAMAIDPNVGAVKEYLAKIKVSGRGPHRNMFEALNIQYFGPVDGHDLPELVRQFEILRHITGPKLLHVITTKGKGFAEAEKQQVLFHAPGKFDRHTGAIISQKDPGLPKIQDVFGKTLLELAQGNPRIMGITPAMPSGSSLRYMMEVFPKRAFDVGIAEQHAVTLSAGLAAEGQIPFCVVYSTFLQRAYDQIIHDVALQNLPVILCIDRGGLVGADGATHHGVFDLAYLRFIPNMGIIAPRNDIELRNALYTAQQYTKGPLAIRYPKGIAQHTDWQRDFRLLEWGKGELIKSGSELIVIAIGKTAIDAQSAIESLEGALAEQVGLADLRFVKPLDDDLLHEICKKYKRIITVEDGVVEGGAGSAVLEWVNDAGYSIPVKRLGVPDQFIEHGNLNELYVEVGIDSRSIADEIRLQLTLL